MVRLRTFSASSSTLANLVFDGREANAHRRRKLTLGHPLLCRHWPHTPVFQDLVDDVRDELDQLEFGLGRAVTRAFFSQGHSDLHAAGADSVWMIASVLRLWVGYGLSTRRGLSLKSTSCQRATLLACPCPAFGSSGLKP